MKLEHLGYAMSYQTLHRNSRELKIRPICEALTNLSSAMSMGPA